MFSHVSKIRSQNLASPCVIVSSVFSIHLFLCVTRALSRMWSWFLLPMATSLSVLTLIAVSIMITQSYTVFWTSTESKGRKKEYFPLLYAIIKLTVMSYVSAGTNLSVLITDKASLYFFSFSFTSVIFFFCCNSDLVQCLCLSLCLLSNWLTYEATDSGHWSIITPCHFIIDTNTIHRPKTKSKQMCRFSATTNSVYPLSKRLLLAFPIISYVFWCFLFLRWACPTCSDFLNLVQGIMDLQELLAKMTLKVKTMKSLPHKKLPQPNTEKQKLNMKTVGSHVSE